MNRRPSYIFSIFRIYTGFYLLVMFLNSLAYSTDIWSNSGMISSADLNATYGVFPSVLNYFEDAVQVKIFLVVLALLAALFMMGVQRKIAAFLLWYGFTCLLNRNNLIINPSIHYIGWLLLASLIVPAGEPLSLSGKKEGWTMPPMIYTCAWILFVLGYFISGIDKLFAPSWVDGTAFRKIINCPLGYGWNRELFENVPDSLMRVINWATLVLELICLPLAIFSVTRKWAWYIAGILQIAILLTLNIVPIALGMFTIHIFTFDENWIRKKKPAGNF